MVQSNKLDLICIEKILRHIQTIKDACILFNIYDPNDLALNEICQLAVTQAITNIYELKQKIQNETINKMILFSNLKFGLKAARNIASHDYDSLDFGIIYGLIEKLMRDDLIDELEVVKHGIQQNNSIS